MQHESGKTAPAIYLQSANEKEAFSQLKRKTRLSSFQTWTPLVGEYKRRR
jgi:hypothetical protein